MYFLLYLTPLGTIGEVTELLSGPSAGFSFLANATPPALKGIKDIILWGFLLLMIQKPVKPADFVIGVGWLVTLASAVLLSVVLSTVHGAEASILVSGLRWLFPLVLVGFAIGRVGNSDLLTVSKIFERLFILNFVLQIVQAFFAPAYFGAIGFLNLRNTGFFVVPNTAGIFVVICAYLRLYFSEKDKQSSTSMFVYFLSAVATGSSAGILGMLALYGHYLTRNFRSIAIAASPLFVFILAILFYEFSEFIRGPGALGITTETRLNLLLNSFSKSDYVSGQFGQYTNTAVLLSGLGKGLVADSLWTSLSGNLGLIGIAVIGFCLFLFGVLSMITRDERVLPFFLIILVASVSSTTLESFPFNLAAVLLLGYFLRAQANDAARPSVHQPGLSKA